MPSEIEYDRTYPFALARKVFQQLSNGSSYRLDCSLCCLMRQALENPSCENRQVFGSHLRTTFDENVLVDLIVEMEACLGFRVATYDDGETSQDAICTIGGCYFKILDKQLALRL